MRAPQWVTACVWLGLAHSAAVLADDLLVVTGAATPVMNLNKSQIRNVFLGKINTFPDGSQAMPVDLKEPNPLRDEFYQKVTNLSTAQAKAQWAKLHFTGRGQPPKEGASSAEVKRLLNSTPGAIGYIEKGAMDDSLQIVFTVK